MPGLYCAVAGGTRRRGIPRAGSGHRPDSVHRDSSVRKRCSASPTRCSRNAADQRVHLLPGQRSERAPVPCPDSDHDGRPTFARLLANLTGLLRRSSSAPPLGSQFIDSRGGPASRHFLEDQTMLRRDFLGIGALFVASLIAGSALAQSAGERPAQRARKRARRRDEGTPGSDPCASGNCGLEFSSRGGHDRGVTSAMGFRFRRSGGRRRAYGRRSFRRSRGRRIRSGRRFTRRGFRSRFRRR
jgi:hypothetical protein